MKFDRNLPDITDPAVRSYFFPHSKSDKKDPGANDGK